MGKLNCFHCGKKYSKKKHSFNDKLFCGNDCAGVYQLLTENNLISYYGFQQFPGKPKTRPTTSYATLKNRKKLEDLYDFSDNEIRIITFKIPNIHSKACTWLLENLSELTHAVKTSEVNFLKKEVRIVFDTTTLSLEQLIQLLNSIGYAPCLKLDVTTSTKQKIFGAIPNEWVVINSNLSTLLLISSLVSVLSIFLLIGMFAWHMLSL